MAQPLEQRMAMSTAVWCGRSWEALVDRRCDAFAQAVALREASDEDSTRVVSDFLEFFDETGVALFRDEEEWIFRTLRPTPPAVIRALEEHIQISGLITALIDEATAGCTDLCVVHALGALLEEHLLSEEAQVRPLFDEPTQAGRSSLSPCALPERPVRAAPLHEHAERQGAMMQTTRMTGPMRRSLEIRLADLDQRIQTLSAQHEGDDSLEATALLEELRRERTDVVELLRDATLIDDAPFDTEAIEIGDTVTIRDPEGSTDRYVLVDGNMRTRAQSDWVSASSPLGAALLGRSKEDEVNVESPSGRMSYVIVDFERASEDSVVHAGSRESVPVEEGRLLPSECFLG